MNPLKAVAKAILPESMLLRRLARKKLSREAALQAVLKLSNGGTFVDIGAHEGAWSSVAAEKFKVVHAFEPNSSLSQKLERVLPRNVTVHNVALSNSSGTATLVLPIIGGSTITSRASLEPDANGPVKTVTVEVAKRTVDSYDFRGVDVMKIDVEGHEMSALQGAEQTISREKPALVVEIEERHHPGESESIIAWVKGRGYDCFYIEHGKVKPFQAGEIARLQPNDPRLWEVGEPSQDYLNNFIFLPSNRTDLLSRLS
jgi:FkbM family methyltransferase